MLTVEKYFLWLKESIARNHSRNFLIPEIPKLELIEWRIDEDFIKKHI